MKLRKALAMLVLNMLINGIKCQNNLDRDIDESYDQTTVEMITVETTTQDIFIITDIPQSDIDAAMNLDVGEYTTQVYDYANFHFRTVTTAEYCYKQYFKCILNQGVMYPVCSVNNPSSGDSGLITFNSICDVFLDNCRRKRHFWRVIAPGKCVKGNFDYEETRRESDGIRPWKFIF